MPADSKNDEKPFASLDKIFEEPIFKPISENFLRIRRNLLLISVLGILYGVGTFNVGELTISGIHIQDGNKILIEAASFFIILYQFIHFSVEACEHLIYWRLRLTGTRLANVTTGKFAHQEGDYPDDPQQSTLYSWWVVQKRQLKGWNEIKNETSEINSLIESFISSTAFNGTRNEVAPLANQANSLNQALKQIIETLSSQRVSASLERFDKGFWSFQKLQLFKWATLELGLPFTLGFVALCLMFPPIFITFVKATYISLTKASFLS